MAELKEPTAKQVEEAFIAGCGECIAIGSRWVNLRMCLVCGKTGCCDSSPMKHASQHYADTGHIYIRSIQPGEDWVWNFETQEVVD